MTPALPQPQPLSLPEYLLKARRTNRFENNPEEFDNLRFGYFGETGGLLAAVKKSGRDQLTEPQSALAAEELGDALWYLVSTAHLLGVSADDLGEHCLRRLRQRFGDSDRPAVLPVSFRQIDALLDTYKEGWGLDRIQQLGALAHSAGNLASITITKFEAMSPPALREHFGILFAEWAITCGCFHLRTEDIARSNLEKISSRWPGDEKVYPALFDSDERFPEYEQFPRTFDIEFIERDGYVVQSLRGVFIGDRLTDNSNEEDHYRYHDVFHLAYIAYLGWSPVIRGLLKRKRKSDPRIDENEDGARAMIIEEGIATWIFNHARRFGLYENVEVGKLDYSLLKQIQNMVEGYEVASCKLWQWELAILKGFEVFRLLRQHRGGIVTVDMHQHALTFRPHPADP
ncbi:nucleoside triphosphate pyrophosphohydrolase family protein [Lysobacter gummosus]|uniref:Nucleoside triphosphate pyrophosphohydrolase family protein n=1 Tax=Lysobacter gummosus TaxID=262324 RepID=A0ABY3XEJ0_9GAMM|nr:nucleoside triphosphate pyrophosphohydrolase family protein [Lysobacter gummosus]UNP30072.1 nucleoside triphosphate pyrophosphohydrolase family protein [Lysobacter gummosus]